MAKILVTYFSVTGHTQALAEAVAVGATAVEGVQCALKPVDEVDNDDLVAADGVIVGSPTYFGQMAADVKRMFDRTERVYGQLEGKVGAAFTTSGGAGCGHELTNMSIVVAMLVAGMLVQGTTQGPHFGPFAVGAPQARQLQQARDMGARVAQLTTKLFG